MRVEIQEISTLPDTLFKFGSSSECDSVPNYQSCLSSSLLYEKDEETVKGGTFRDLLTHFMSQKGTVSLQVSEI